MIDRYFGTGVVMPGWSKIEPQEYDMEIKLYHAVPEKMIGDYLRVCRFYPVSYWSKPTLIISLSILRD